MNGKMSVPMMPVANGRTFPVTQVEKISGTFQREYGAGPRRKREFIVYVNVDGVEFEGIISSARPAADAYRQKWTAAQAAAQQDSGSDEGGSDHYRRMSFAIMKELDMPLRKAGVSERQVWEELKREHDVASRSEFTEKQWALVAATLKGAQDDVVLFKALIDKVKAQQRDMQVENAQVTATGAVHGKVSEQLTEADRLRQEWAANPQF